MRKALFVLVGLLLAVPLVAQPRSVQIDGTLKAVDECVTMDTSTMGTATIRVRGSFVGTIAFYQAGSVVPSLWATAVHAPALPVTSTTAEGQWVASVLGVDSVRACFSSYTSGSATVTVSATQMPADTRPPCNNVTKASGRCRP